MGKILTKRKTNKITKLKTAKKRDTYTHRRKHTDTDPNTHTHTHTLEPETLPYVTHTDGRNTDTETRHTRSHTERSTDSGTYVLLTRGRTRHSLLLPIGPDTTTGVNTTIVTHASGDPQPR